MSIIAIVQARMKSTRLPGKVLLPLDGERTALECMLERVSQSKLVEKIIVATTTEPEEDEIVTKLEEWQQPYIRGSEHDVLDRYKVAAETFAKPGDVIVRLTSDCPVIDYRVIDKVINGFLNKEADFVSNSIEPYSYPDGMDVEVFSYENLMRAAKEATLPSHREHVTFYFYQNENPDLFSVKYVQSPIDYTRYRVTLDYSQDYELLKAIFAHFSPRKDFSLEEINDFLEQNPEVVTLDGRAARNLGWQSAFKKDEEFKK